MGGHAQPAAGIFTVFYSVKHLLGCKTKKVIGIVDIDPALHFAGLLDWILACVQAEEHIEVHKKWKLRADCQQNVDVLINLEIRDQIADYVAAHAVCHHNEFVVICCACPIGFGNGFGDAQGNGSRAVFGAALAEIAKRIADECGEATVKNLSGGIAYGHRRYMSAGLIGFFMHCSSPIDDGLGRFGYGTSHDFAGYF